MAYKYYLVVKRLCSRYDKWDLSLRNTLQILHFLLKESTTSIVEVPAARVDYRSNSTCHSWKNNWLLMCKIGPLAVSKCKFKWLQHTGIWTRIWFWKTRWPYLRANAQIFIWINERFICTACISFKYVGGVQCIWVKVTGKSKTL